MAKRAAGSEVVVVEADMVDPDDIAPGLEDVDLTKIRTVSGLREIGTELQADVRGLLDEVDDLTDTVESREATLAAYKSVACDWQTTAEQAQSNAERANLTSVQALSLRDEAMRELRGARSLFMSILRAKSEVGPRLLADLRVARANEAACAAYAKTAESVNHGLAARVLEMEAEVGAKADELAECQHKVNAALESRDVARALRDDLRQDVANLKYRLVPLVAIIGAAIGGSIAGTIASLLR